MRVGNSSHRRRYERTTGGKRRPVCFVFLDGVGLAPADGSNPLAWAAMPNVRRLLGGPMVADQSVDKDGLLLLPLDACLGVEGLPQSATGQTALFTGVNAAALVGAHVAAYPTETLRQVIAGHSVLKRATDHGLRATFANAYTGTYWQRVAQDKLRHSASTLTTMAAGLRFRTLDDLRRGEAVYGTSPTWQPENTTNSTCHSSRQKKLERAWPACRRLTTW